MNLSLLPDAIDFATERHRGSLRDGESPLPYITHPIDVVNQLRYVGLVKDDVVLCAGALHDVLEETPTQPKDLVRFFGEPVTRLVLELTRYEPNARETKDLTREEVWALRNGILMDEIAKMSPEAKTVKLADRISNLTAAWSVRSGAKLARYLRQTNQMLEIIPPAVNPELWRALRNLNDANSREV